jgi:hypothetical protein
MGTAILFDVNLKPDLEDTDWYNLSEEDTLWIWLNEIVTDMIIPDLWFILQILTFGTTSIGDLRIVFSSQFDASLFYFWGSLQLYYQWFWAIVWYALTWWYYVFEATYTFFVGISYGYDIMSVISYMIFY